MNTIRTFTFAVLLFLSGVAAVSAQDQPKAGTSSPEPTVTVSVSAGGVRFVALGGVRQVRLEVFGAGGETVYNSDFQPGSVRDWKLEDRQGQPLPDGDYLCVVTVRSVSGRLSVRQGSVLVQGGQASLQFGEGGQGGPVEPERALAPVAEADATSAVALLAHDGRDGQVVTTTGDLSFRGGDFFTGRDKELMRLSRDGTLEVTGALLARGGIRFADGTVLSSARGFGRVAAGKGEKGAGTGAPDPGVSPTAVLNRLPKYNSSGTLVDSAFSDVSGTLGVGTDSPDMNYKLDVRGHAVLGNTRRISLVADFAGNGEIAPGGFFGSLGQNSLSFAPSTDFGNAGARVKFVYYNGGQWLSALEYANVSGGGVSSLTLMKNGGSVGVGSAGAPARLNVSGDLNVSGNVAAKYQDVAEWVPARHRMPAGTVVVLDKTRANTVRASARAYSTHVAGVVSARPGLILGEAGDDKVMVATTGRVKVMVDATRRPVRIGDLLVTSGRPGVAMRSLPVRVSGARLHRPGTIIGKALEPLSGRVGEIEVLLSLQ